jgi:hypothetical protein
MIKPLRNSEGAFSITRTSNAPICKSLEWKKPSPVGRGFVIVEAPSPTGSQSNPLPTSTNDQASSQQRRGFFNTKKSKSIQLGAHFNKEKLPAPRYL